jgi:predicted metal-dependent hydrolase
MKEEIKKYVGKVSSILGIKTPALVIRDLSEIHVFGLADIAGNTIYLHNNQMDWKDTVKHECSHLANKRHGHDRNFWELMIYLEKTIERR